MKYTNITYNESLEYLNSKNLENIFDILQEPKDENKQNNTTRNKKW